MEDRPNIIFILTDDQGYGDLGCTGNPILNTPNIDHFHNESVRLTNFHVGPTCAPTRAGLMTGHYANSTGVWHTVGGRSLLRKDEWTLALALNENNYRTGIFGKWHLGDEYPYRPHDRGFETSIVHGGGGVGQTPDYWGNDYFDDTYYVNGIPEKFNGYCTDVFFKEAIDFIYRNKDESFFCYIATNAPHMPYNVDKKYSDAYQGKVCDDRARFYGMITNIDENFGLLRERLKEWGLEHNTILIFMTDNGSSGGSTLDSRSFVKEGFNAGLRGMKNSEYDGGHRVPFFIRWPAGNLAHGSDINEITANIDFMPTILNICKIPVMKGVSFHGKDISPLLYGKYDKWEERTIVTDSQRVAYPSKWRKSSVMTNGWRLVNGKELYDMGKDREQRYDVACHNKKVVERLRGEYEKWWDKVSVNFDEEAPVVLGDKPTEFTCHDLRNEECDTAWHQGHIRRGINVFGYWEIEVEKEGVWQFELSRWPKSEKRPVTEGINGYDITFSRDNIQQKGWGLYSGGKSLKLNEAIIRIQGKTASVNIGNKDTCAVFKLELKRGRTRLEAWFNDTEGNAYTAAYYIAALPIQNKNKT